MIMAASGAGALAGSVGVALVGIRRRRGLLLILSGIGAGIILCAFAFARTLTLASAALVVLGGVVMVFMGMANTLLQTYTPLEMRGRVMSIYTMVFLGMMPLGSWLFGTVASLSSLQISFAAGGFIVVLASLIASSRIQLRELA